MILPYKAQSDIKNITYSFYDSPFGACLIALHEQAICHLSFVDDNCDAALARLKKQWQHAQLVENSDEIAVCGKAIFFNKQKEWQLTVSGTVFQQEVWRAASAITRGKTVSYQDIANAIKKPWAVRAVGSALACNQIAYLIPCHRVIKKSGAVHHYRWGHERKKALLAHEKEHQ